MNCARRARRCRRLRRSIFAPRGSATPTLTLNTQAPIAPAPAEETRIPEVKLSPEEQQVVEEFANRIDITDSSLILGYGAAAQQKISKFTESALDKVRTHDLGEAGELMTQLMGQLKGFTDEERAGSLACPQGAVAGRADEGAL